MELGDQKTIRYECLERVCNECGEPATKKITFLLENCRRNPASKAYGRDDCSWCEDDCVFSCDEHAEEIRRKPPEGMSWCSIFPRDKFKHMFLYWKQKDEIYLTLEEIMSPLENVGKITHDQTN